MNLYLFYKHEIYPRIKNILGATRFISTLKRVTFRQLEEYEDAAEGIMEKDWDNLIILDACRHDLYEEMKREKIDKRVTLGSTSKEFIEKNFGDSHDDIV